MTSQLLAAIKDLYAVFRRRGPAPVVRGCPCCTTPAEFEHLASTPLKHLSAEQLDRYARKALTTAGTVEDFKYFLPRMIELAIEDQLVVDREVVFGKLRHAGWMDWPAPERDAIAAVARAIAATFASIEYEPHEIDGWVCSLGRFVDDLPEHLAPLLSDTETAKANLIRLREYNTDEFGAHQVTNAFWDTDARSTVVFAEWLQTPAVRWATT